MSCRTHSTLPTRLTNKPEKAKRRTTTLRNLLCGGSQSKGKITHVVVGPTYIYSFRIFAMPIDSATSVRLVQCDACKLMCVSSFAVLATYQYGQTAIGARVCFKCPAISKSPRPCALASFRRFEPASSHVKLGFRYRPI